MAKFKPSRQIGVGGLVLTRREKKYLNQVIQTSRLSYGPMTQKLEALFAREHDCKYAVFCNSGTSALHIAVQALKIRNGWKDGDEVIVPSMTFVATANVVLHNQMVPKFVDVEPDIHNIDPKLIESAITPRTRAIIPVHMFGQAASMDEVAGIASRHGLKIIEDSCETMFARYRGRKVGSLGDIGCFSTYVAHLLVTGVGGFATTNDPELAVLLKSLMNHGRDSIYLSIDDDKVADKEKLFDIVARRFSFVHSGHSFRCTEMEAAIGLGQLEQNNEFMAKRSANAKRLTEGLADLGEFLDLPSVRPDRDHVFMMYPLVVKTGLKRELVNYLEERLIETRDLMPLLSQPAIKVTCGVDLANFPVARRLDADGFYIGCHPYLTSGEIGYVIDSFHEFFRTRK